MFKNIFKHKIVKDIKDKSIFSRNSDHGNHPMSPNSAEETHHDKPFEIDLDNLSSYDQKELQAFIKKYEQYTHSLRDLLNECLLAREKLTLLDEERKRLMVENDQYKNQIEVFKKLVDEKALQAGAGPDFDREAIENSGLEFEKKELNISKQLKENAEKLIEELKKIILMSNGEEVKKAPEFVKKEMEDVDRQGQEESPREEARTTSGSDSECKPEAEPVNEAEAEQTEQQEEKEEVENPEEMKNNEVPQSHQSESPTGEEDKMSSVLEKVELELRKVLEEHWNTIDAMLKKEKEMSLRLNMEILKGRKMEEYEKEIKELKGTAKDAEKLLQDTIVELQDKVKEVEKNEKIVEETEAKLEQEKVHHDEEMMLQKKIAEELQVALGKVKEEDEEKKNIIEEIKKENNMLQQQLKEVKDRLEEYSEKVKQIENIQQKFHKIEQRNKELEKEKEEFDDKYNKLETKRNDTENSLIQEKLKHHQTSGDLTRANEKLVEMEKNLNEEIEARKADVWKNEDLKKHIVELERKLRESIKMIKKLSNKVAELENKEKNESNSSNRTNSDPDIQDIGSNNDTPNKQEYGNKGYYETRLEDAMSQINELKEANQKLVEEKEVLKGQAKILQEKRETGLQEIKRLNVLLEQARSSKGQNFIIPNVKTEEISKPIRVGSMNTIKVSKKSKAQEDLNNLRRIKQGLDGVYKSIIMTITAENLREESGHDERKATGKLGELVKGPLPSESFMTIEKKMNDTIVLFQEYMENFE